MGHGCHDCGCPNGCECSELKPPDISKEDYLHFIKTGRGTWEVADCSKSNPKAPISIDIEDGECTLRINGLPVGFCRKIEFKMEVGKPSELIIERLAYHPQRGFMEDVEAVKGHVGHLKLISDYYQTKEGSEDYFKR